MKARALPAPENTGVRAKAAYAQTVSSTELEKPGAPPNPPSAFCRALSSLAKATVSPATEVNAITFLALQTGFVR